MAIDIGGSITLQEAFVLDFNDERKEKLNKVWEVFGRSVKFQLISGDQIEETGVPNVSEEVNLPWHGEKGCMTRDSTYTIIFKWPSGSGTPGAVRVINKHAGEFFLKELTLTIPGKTDNIHFLCNSWIWPSWKARFSSSSTADRIFFANNSYLPVKTPKCLIQLRTEELASLRGNDKDKMKKKHRVYGFDYYNDLGDPDSDEESERNVLGGSRDLPYPRRCRTGRQPTKKNAALETREQKCVEKGFYVPVDEEFQHTSLSVNRAHKLRAFTKLKLGSLPRILKSEFGSLEAVKGLYREGIPALSKEFIEKLKICIPGQLAKALLETDDQALFKFVVPDVIRWDDAAWKTDEEFSRETLSGLNPMVIRCLQSFPPTSNLNSPRIYGDKDSSITDKHIEKYLDGMSVPKAIETKRLFILDYYDAYMPYVERINNLPTSKIYATRTIFFLAEGTLKPVAIELCLPPTSVGQNPRHVFTPGDSGEDNGWLWQLAKVHVRGNDSGYHQLVNHWLRTHAVVEPFVISTHRNLSKLHPVNKLLVPHFRNTLAINRSARESLINAGGIIEQYFSSGKYSMEISAKAYQEWRFKEQGLPADLLKRGMAVEDRTDKVNGLRLVIEDYPYAVDGLEIWTALKSWVSGYISLYYKNDKTVQDDREFQAWWKEIMENGHGDKKDDKEGWYEMKTVEDMKSGITTLIWIASAHHAAVNYGQYSYGGFMPNYPTTTRMLIPNEGSREYKDFLFNPEAYFLKTVSKPETAAYTMAVLELLSRHSTDEVFIGQGSTSEWTDDRRVKPLFDQLRSNLLEIEENIKFRNADPKLKNRCGPANVPYGLLYPGTSDVTKPGGLISRGIPNSISI